MMAENVRKCYPVTIDGIERDGEGHYSYLKIVGAIKNGLYGDPLFRFRFPFPWPDYLDWSVEKRSSFDELMRVGNVISIKINNLREGRLIEISDALSAYKIVHCPDSYPESRCSENIHEYSQLIGYRLIFCRKCGKSLDPGYTINAK
jgi:hypothetical protein